MEGIRVVVLDEVALVRDGVVALLERAGMTVAASSGDAEEFLAQLSSVRPQLAVIGLFVRSSAGLTVLRRARALHPEVRLIVLALGSSSSVRRAALEAGAMGFIDEFTGRAEDLVRAASAVANGQTWTSPHGFDPAKARDPILARLSAREHQVLEFVADGADNLQIAAHLGITERTVKAHVHSIYQKVGSENRTHLALWASQRISHARISASILHSS